jgi:hypothetical protein
LTRIEQYLNQGGRLLCLFNAASRNITTGLEKILSRWGVIVDNIVIKDPENAETIGNGSDVIVSSFSKHPPTAPLYGTAMYLVQPRPVGRLPAQSQGADAAHVEVLFESGAKAFTEDNPAVAARRFPLAVSVEKGNLGVITERGTTRMVVVGESIFLDNKHIDALANRDFANCAINWLLERPQLFEGLGPRPIKEYRFVMSKKQVYAVRILLAAQPAAVLLLGVLVWFRRRR